MRASKVLPYLLQYSSGHQTQGKELQAELKEMELNLRTVMDEIWHEDDEEALPTPSAPGNIPFPKYPLPKRPEMREVGSTILDWEVKLL